MEDDKISARKGMNIIIMLAEKYGCEAVDCSVQEPLTCNFDYEKHIRRAVRASKLLKADSNYLKT